ncbi:MAG: L-asparaginase, partial [Paraburkholderia nemoris]
MAARGASLTIAAMNTLTSSPATPSGEGATPLLPRIAVLATGGTIAGAAADATNTSGYQAGV